MKKALILQSNYIPWKGYFYAIKEVDVFVMYDDVQYTKNDWRNRNLIKSKSGLQWLTIPIETKNKSCQKINEAKIVNSFWASKHLLSIKHNYSRATYYKQYIPFFEDLYNSCKSNYLIDINRIFLTKICELLEIKTTIIHSSDYDLKSTNKTERIVEMCSKIKVSDYYSGPAARAYIETDLFDSANINLHYFNYGNFPTYQQLYLPFLHEVSIIDVILNTGPDAKKYIEKNSLENPFTQPVYQYR